MEIALFCISLILGVALLFVCLIGYQESQLADRLEKEVHRWRESCKTEHADAEVTTNKLREDYAALESLHNQLQARHKEVVDKLAVSAVDVVRLERELTQVRGLVKIEADRIRVQLDNTIAERDRLKHELENSREDYKLACKVRDEHHVNYHTAKDKIDGLRNENTALRNENASLRKGAEAAQNTIDHLHKTAAENRKRIVELVEERNRMLDIVSQADISANLCKMRLDSLLVRPQQDPAKTDVCRHTHQSVVLESHAGFVYVCKACGKHFRDSVEVKLNPKTNSYERV